jgi:hypothetical protein
VPATVVIAGSGALIIDRTVKIAHNAISQLPPLDRHQRFKTWSVRNRSLSGGL